MIFQTIKTHLSTPDTPTRRFLRTWTPHPGSVLFTLVVVGVVLFVRDVNAFPLGQGDEQTSETPQTIHYQGYLTDPDGTPLTKTISEIRFEVFNVDIGGKIIGCEIHQGVEVVDGLFSVPLGNGTVDEGDCNAIPSLGVDLLVADSIWLEIHVDGEKLDPRQQMNGVLRAVDAERLDGISASSIVIQDENGNVGIGTTDANGLFGRSRLSINGRVGTQDGINESEWFVGSSGGITATHIGSTTEIPFAFYAGNSAPQMLLTTSGDVGIGTLAPEAQLSIKGTSTTGKYFQIVSAKDQGQFVIDSDENEDARLRLKSNDGQDRIEIIAGSGGGELKLFDTEGNEKVKMDVVGENSSFPGRIAINSTPDNGHSLKVGGAVRISHGTLTVADGDIILKDGSLLPVPDYVFAEDYSLMSLDDLRSYIVQESHLPNIPNAEEIDQNGLNLGQFQMLLLEKIEELTLYTLAQQEEIEALRRQVDDLQGR
ncbi:MAG: hypothetical protein AAF702_30550 [Chloroflexota bacterium]